MLESLRSQLARDLGDRWLRNVMLNKWLDYCVERGHHFPAPRPDAPRARTRARYGILRSAEQPAPAPAPGARPLAEDERLLQLYWNRAELQERAVALAGRASQADRAAEQHEASYVRQQRAAVAARGTSRQSRDRPARAGLFPIALAVARLSAKIARFAQQLQQQQADREQRRQVLEFDRARRQQLADFDRRIATARSRADTVGSAAEAAGSEARARCAASGTTRRRRLAEEIAAEREQWDLAATEVTDLSDDRNALEDKAPPPFEGISIDGRRVVNTAVIAYAQQLVVTLSAGGLAVLAKETTTKRVFDMKYGTREECSRLMMLLREALAVVKNEKDDLSGLKEAHRRVARGGCLSQRCGYGAAHGLYRRLAGGGGARVGPGDRQQRQGRRERPGGRLLRICIRRCCNEQRLMVR